MPNNVQIYPSADAVAGVTADILADLVRTKQDCVLGLSTGSSPLSTYARLIQIHREDGLCFARTRTFNLDEYVGLCGSHEQSYRAYMDRHLFDHIDVPIEHTDVMDGCADSLDAECDRFERAVAEAGSVDVWLLGIGVNGHIAFNEPGTDPSSRTRSITLAPETIQANSRFFDNPSQVPKQALTAGIATILDGRRILLIATGESKAAPVRDAIEGPVDPTCPASHLQLHTDCTFILDEPAACLLNR